jgi:serine/threonine protein kinase
MVKRDNIVEQLIKEIKIQSFFSHSHIVKLYSIFDDK